MAVMSVVRFASTMVVVALPNPLRIAMRSVEPRSISSRIRSKISTFASTDMPTVSTRPASPVKLNGCLTRMIMATMQMRLVIKAKQATAPQKP